MARVSVLNICFHGIGSPQRELEPGEDFYWVSAPSFVQILDEITTWPSVRISFDDGNASDAEIVLPALMERGLTAQFFPVAGRLGQPGSLTAGDVRMLADRGMMIGSHGMSHRSWRDMDQAARQAELIEARRLLEEASGSVIVDVACPRGRYDRHLLSDLRRIGYRQVFTSDRRPARRGVWLQPRFSVRHEDTPESMRAAVLNRRRLAWVPRDIMCLAKRLR